MVYVAKWIIQSSVTACNESDHLMQPVAMLPAGQCHITLPHETSAPCDAVFRHNSLTACYFSLHYRSSM